MRERIGRLCAFLADSTLLSIALVVAVGGAR